MTAKRLLPQLTMEILQLDTTTADLNREIYMVVPELLEERLHHIQHLYQKDRMIC